MSSQLWISVTITDEMKDQYIVATTQVKKQIIMDYVALSEHFPDESIDI
jgi:hypothetical protein